MPASPRAYTEVLVSTAADVHINCWDFPGPGPAVVILHGLAGSAQEFVATAAALGDFRTILVDLRGHGRSTRRPADLSRAAFVHDVVRVLEDLVGGPAILLGQSMGGHTALLVAAARPDLVTRLILLETGPGSGDEQQAQALGAFFRSWPVPFATLAAARDFLGAGVLAQAWLADLAERPDGLWPRFDADVMGATIAAVATPQWAAWESLRMPVFVVFGEHGMFTAAERAEFLARGHGVRHQVLAGAGHDAHLETPAAWVNYLTTVALADLHATDPTR